jgi:hypothetical protein
MARRRQKTAEPEDCGPASGKSSRRTPPGYRGRDERTADNGTGEILLGALEWDGRSDKAEPKRPGAKRKSEGVEVPKKRGRITSRREGPLLESSFWKR